MEVFFQTFTLCLVLSLSSTAPSFEDRMMADHHADHAKEDHYEAKINRCDGVEFDAIVTDEHGVIYFFKGEYMWSGFRQPAIQINKEFSKNIDAAFHMHYPAESSYHNHMFFFHNDKVFSIFKDSRVEGYPKDISEVFPGIPDNLDAAVECPKGECVADSVLFFKENEVFAFDIRTKTVQKRPWTHLPNCTSALRWLEHYYCFHGHNFTRFHPVTGAVVGNYPKDSRDYFMRCTNFGHGGNDTERERCSLEHLDAITSDDLGKAYAFRGDFYLRLSDSQADGWHAFPIASTWKDIKGDVEAVFSYHGKLYFIKDEQVFIYKSGDEHTLIEGYPKPLKEELGIDGPVNAAFVCGEYEIVHVIKDHKMYDIDLSATPRKVLRALSVPFPKIDAATCGPDGIKVFVGPRFFHYETPRLFALSRINPIPHKISTELLGCDQ
ncbi:hemopexin-like [Xyrauchen texanus]|uniref:hemopexin-like n=1 Tax=Xyrauchen texanus TaxID=154827 RepID=UPI002241B9F2|nr:hemopexin-like [Xyrauchen texanus]